MTPGGNHTPRRKWTAVIRPGGLLTWGNRHAVGEVCRGHPGSWKESEGSYDPDTVYTHEIAKEFFKKLNRI